MTQILTGDIEKAIRRDVRRAGTCLALLIIYSILLATTRTSWVRIVACGFIGFNAYLIAAASQRIFLLTLALAKAWRP